jgi:uncharacterized protein YndB with AHSA1/START domain
MAARSNAPLGVGTEVVLTRVIDAPRELVFDAWTDPEHMAQWWGPRGYSVPACELDPRPGGVLSLVMRDSDGNDSRVHGTYREVVRPERLVFTAIVPGPDGETLVETLQTITLMEQEGRTHLTVRARVDRLAPGASWMIEGMDDGWGQSLDRLAEFAAAPGRSR